MRIQPIFLTCLTFLSSYPLPLLAQPSFSEANKPIILAQQNQKSVLDQWQLSFQELTWKDGTFKIKIPGLCPVERPGAKCRYPKPQVDVKSGNQNGKPYQIINIDGGSYEVAFSFSAVEVSGFSTDAKSQQGWLDNQIQFWRRKLEQEGGATLISAREIVVNGHKGVELAWQGERHQSGLSSDFVRIIIAGNRRYELGVGTLDRLAPILMDDVKTFFNGFQILKVTS